MKNDFLDIGRIIFDPKMIGILEKLNEEELSVKELAKKLNEQSSNLYYPIKKLLESGLIKVNREERINNLIEKYYVSTNYYSKYKDSISFEGNIVRKHYDDLIKTVMLEMNHSFKNLQNDIQSSQSSENTTAEYSFIEKKLSYDNWKKLNESIRDLVDKFPEDENGENYRFLITGYKV